MLLIVIAVNRYFAVAQPLQVHFLWKTNAKTALLVPNLIYDMKHSHRYDRLPHYKRAYQCGGFVRARNVALLVSYSHTSCPTARLI